MRDIFDQIRKRMQPPQWASWQTLIFLSVFSALIAALTTQDAPQIAQRIISSFGWIFLILGVWWFVYEPEVKKKLKVYELFIGPWIVGALICVYLFGTWEGRAIPAPTALISWPPISAIVWSTPKFIKSDPKTKSPIYTPPTSGDRQDIILVLLANLILSCWFQFYFVLQDWLVEYPSLRADDFGRSAFVWELQQPDRRAESSRGVDLLNAAEQSLKEKLSGKLWSDTELWLFQLDQERNTLRNDALAKLPRIAESKLWDLNLSVSNPNRVADAYDLDLQAIWQGPSARSKRYSLVKTCRLTQGRKAGQAEQFKFNNSAPPAVSQARTQTITNIQCGDVKEQDTNAPIQL